MGSVGCMRLMWMGVVCRGFVRGGDVVKYETFDEERYKFMYYSQTEGSLARKLLQGKIPSCA